MTAHHPRCMPIRVKVNATTSFAFARCPACRTGVGASPDEVRAAADYHARTCYALRENNIGKCLEEAEALFDDGRFYEWESLICQLETTAAFTWKAPCNRRSGYDAWPTKEQA